MWLTDSRDNIVKSLKEDSNTPFKHPADTIQVIRLPWTVRSAGTDGISHSSPRSGASGIPVNALARVMVILFLKCPPTLILLPAILIKLTTLDISVIAHFDHPVLQ
jgi:hypothetical protein